MPIGDNGDVHALLLTWKVTTPLEVKFPLKNDQPALAFTTRQICRMIVKGGGNRGSFVTLLDGGGTLFWRLDLYSSPPVISSLLFGGLQLAEQGTGILGS